MKLSSAIKFHCISVCVLLPRMPHHCCIVRQKLRAQAISGNHIYQKWNAGMAEQTFFLLHLSGGVWGLPTCVDHEPSWSLHRPQRYTCSFAPEANLSGCRGLSSPETFFLCSEVGISVSTIEFILFCSLVSCEYNHSHVQGDWLKPYQ